VIYPVDSTIRRIVIYPVDSTIRRIVIYPVDSTIRRIVIYPVDSAINLLSNRGQSYTCMQSFFSQKIIGRE